MTCEWMPLRGGLSSDLYCALLLLLLIVCLFRSLCVRVRMLQIWDLNSRKCTQILEHAGGVSSVCALHCSGGQLLIASGGEDTKVFSFFMLV